MSEMRPDFGLSPQESEQLALDGYCGEMLGNTIPKLLQRSDEAQKDILYAGAADVDVAFLSYDYLVDGLQSYRVRLVPRKQLLSLPTFRGSGTVRQVIINVPVDFVNNPQKIDDIELALVSLYVDTPQTTIAEKFLITPHSVQEIINFTELDFDFYYDEEKGASHIKGVKLKPTNKSPYEVPLSDVNTQLKNAIDIYDTLGSLIIGNQSLNDGTALE